MKKLKKAIKKAPRLLLPTLLCAWCKETIRSGSRKMSHGICRTCTVRFFGKLRRATA